MYREICIFLWEKSNRNSDFYILTISQFVGFKSFVTRHCHLLYVYDSVSPWSSFHFSNFFILFVVRCRICIRSVGFISIPIPFNVCALLILVIVQCFLYFSKLSHKISCNVLYSLSVSFGSEKFSINCCLKAFNLSFRVWFGFFQASGVKIFIIILLCKSFIV